MARRTLHINSESQRQKAIKWLTDAPLGFYVTFKRNKRSNDQNSLMWVLLGCFAEQAELMGQTYSDEDWKLIFLNALGHEMRLAPSLGGNGFVNLGRRSSRLSKQEMSDLIELIYAEGAARGVDFGTNQKEAA